MRPRKAILLVDSDAARRSSRTFALSTVSLRLQVHERDSAEQALQAVRLSAESDFRIYGVLIASDLPFSENLIERIQVISAIPCVWTQPQMFMSDLLKIAETLVIQKRGPKPVAKPVVKKGIP